MSNHFWNEVLQRLEIVKSIDRDDGMAVAKLLTELEHITEVYAKQFDPVDCFSEYLMVDFLQEINAILNHSASSK
ncbi:MAG: hypothetical protein WCY88_03435 [Spongiibacteraceae bacterium]